MPLQRATIHTFDPITWRAEVELAGAPTALLPGVPVAADLGPDLLAPGARVWLDLSAEGNPADSLVLAPCGAPAPWVTARLWRPAPATAVLAGAAVCTATAYERVAGLTVTLSLAVTGSVLLLLAATGRLEQAGVRYTLAFHHDDAHELTLLAPEAAVGGPGAGAGERWALTWLALQRGIAPGEHTFTLRHCASGGAVAVERALIVALAMGD